MIFLWHLTRDMLTTFHGRYYPPPPSHPASLSLWWGVSLCLASERVAALGNSRARNPYQSLSGWQALSKHLTRYLNEPGGLGGVGGVIARHEDPDPECHAASSAVVVRHKGNRPEMGFRVFRSTPILAQVLGWKWWDLTTYVLYSTRTPKQQFSVDWECEAGASDGG